MVSAEAQHSQHGVGDNRSLILDVVLSAFIGGLAGCEGKAGLAHGFFCDEEQARERDDDAAVTLAQYLSALSDRLQSLYDSVYDHFQQSSRSRNHGQRSRATQIDWI